MPAPKLADQYTSTSNLSAPSATGNLAKSLQQGPKEASTAAEIHAPSSPPSSRTATKMPSFKPGLLPGLGKFECKPFEQGALVARQPAPHSSDVLTKDLNLLCSQADPTGAQMMAVNSPQL